MQEISQYLSEQQEIERRKKQDRIFWTFAGVFLAIVLIAAFLAIVKVTLPVYEGEAATASIR